MSSYIREWECCESETRTEAWIPDQCPFCTMDPESWIAAWAVEWRWQVAARETHGIGWRTLDDVAGVERLEGYFRGYAAGAARVRGLAQEMEAHFDGYAAGKAQGGEA